jgi:hypothetical protein
LCRASGDKGPVRALCLAVGGAYVDLEGVHAELRGKGLAAFLDLVLAAQESFGTQAENLKAALADGRIKRHEYEDFRHAAMRAVEDILALVEAVDLSSECCPLNLRVVG